MKSILMLTATVALLAVLASSATADSQFLIGPRVGFYKTRDANQGNWFGGGSIRAMLTPNIGIEGAADYHADEKFSDQLKVRTVPVTASAIIGIIPQVYLAGGLGWYNTRFDWNKEAEATLGVHDETTTKFGYQFGGGLMLGGTEGSASLVLDGRYHIVNRQKFQTTVGNGNFESIKPDFWSANAGILFRFH